MENFDFVDEYVTPPAKRDILSNTWDNLDTAGGHSPQRRLFSLDQANRSLVLLRRVVGDIVNEYAQLLELEELVESAQQSCSSEKLETARRGLVNTVDVLQTCLEELDQMGVELRDFSRGIVDFPAIHEGREISYCWLLGEKEVSHWHDRSAGFACRQPVSILNKAEILQPSLF